MRIVLVEVRDQQERNERAFAKPLVRVGRDPETCDIVFDQVDYPMVSRRHAELRADEGGNWTVVDSGSKFGTYINGQRIAGSQPLAEGARVQFGAHGPIVRVAQLESAANKLPTVVGYGQQGAPQPPAQPQNDRSPYETVRDIPRESLASVNNTANQSTSPNETTLSRPAAPPIPAPIAQKPAQASKAFIEFSDPATNRAERRELTGDQVLLGREAASIVPIDAGAAVVSRRHAELRRNVAGAQQQYTLVDLGSFNGTLLNGQRITTPAPLFDADEIQLGAGGPVLRIIDPQHPAPAGAERVGQRVITEAGAQVLAASPHQAAFAPSTMNAPAAPDFQRTMVVKSGTSGLQGATQNIGGTGQHQKPQNGGAANGSQPHMQLLMQRMFDAKGTITMGRAETNDVRLDGLQISNTHARFTRTNEGGVTVEDAGSTNGVYVNGERLQGKRPVTAQDVVQIGPFVVYADAARGIAVFDTRAKTRIDVVDITKIVPNRSGGGQIKLLDDVDLTILPNEFVGLLGPSGAGKSTLMDALNGMRPASAGRVFVNNLDFYQHLDSLKQSIGYVPQDDIIHRELTVYRTLYYVARLRLTRDASKQEIDQIINEVMDVTGLAERRDVPVAQLSGGQRKRVSIAVELITKPSIIFLDEPTSGLDPATEEKIMRLFRQIAESGRTVILTTHAMENVRLFDKIVVMMRGKLVFYGTPQEALKHVGADSFKDLYDRLEAPIDAELKKLPALAPNASTDQKRQYKAERERISDAVADNWRNSFHQTPIYQRNIAQPLATLKGETGATAVPRRRAGVIDAVRQWGTLARRYMEVLGRDKFNLLILFAQAPIIALLIYLVVRNDATRDFPYFVLSLVAVWFGTSVAAREVVKEAAVYKRERMVNLGLLPYVGSKLLVLGMIVGAQCILLFGSLKILDVAGLTYLPGSLFGIPQLFLMILTAMVGVALGLFISAIVKTSEMATSLVPLILIPQILFSGLVGVPQGVSKLVGLTMPATWAFDGMKRLSTLDTLREEGSDEEGVNKGRGLYKNVEDINDKQIADARTNIENYRKDADKKLDDYKKKLDDYVKRLQNGETGLTKPDAPKLDDPPAVSDARKVKDEELREYVDFKHPWGHVLLDPVVLLVMFFGLMIATLIALRFQDQG